MSDAPNGSPAGAPQAVRLVSTAIAGAEPASAMTLKSGGPGWSPHIDLPGWSADPDAEELPERAIVVCGPCASSMDVAWALVQQGALPRWGSVLALSQSGGRGRMGRRWVSPPGNVYGAWYWPADSPDLGDMAPIAAGVLVARALCDSLAAECGDSLRLQLKWPNDLVFAGHKVGGVLVEQRGDERVVGIGLNIDPDLALAPRVERDVLPAGTLPLSEAEANPLCAWQRVTGQAPTGVDRVEIIAAAEDRLLWRGDRVRVIDRPEGPLSGFLLGLTPAGALRIAAQGEEYEIRNGTLTPDDSR